MQADRISIPRDGKWLLATWEEYTKPKYKEALSRWNKETGGGDGTLPSFANYACSAWLAWVFCLDSEFDFLLASCSEGRVPKHMNAEGGWEIDENDPKENDDDDNDGSSKKTSAKKTEKVLATTITSLNNLTTTLTLHLETIAEAMKARARSVEMTPAKKVTRTYCLRKVSQMKVEQAMIEQDADITPNTKQENLALIRKRKREWFRKSLKVDDSDDDK